MCFLSIPNEQMQAIRRHAEKDYPEECCGFILSNNTETNEFLEVIACRNAQNDFHKLDPVQFPRTAENAFFIDPADLLKTERKTSETGQTIRAIYHSHIDCDAYFSEEDIRRALVDGSPAYPETIHLVLAVVKGTVKHWKQFFWDAEKLSFREVVDGLANDKEPPCDQSET